MRKAKIKVFSKSIPHFLRVNLTFFVVILIIVLSLLKTSEAYPGNLDSTFSQNGIFHAQIGNPGTLKSAVLQHDGKIISVGWSGNKIIVIRLTGDGLLDLSFDNDGIALTEFSNQVTATAVLFQFDGKIVVAGTSIFNADSNFFLVRYNSDGTPDSSFGTNGIVYTTIGNSRNMAHTATLQLDGKIIVAGENYPAPFMVDCLMARYNSNGSVDTSFGNGGVVRTNIGGFAGINSVKVQQDGRIIAAGYGRTEAANPDFAIVRYQSNGTLDTTLDGDGIVLTQFILELDERINEVALQPDGKIVALGTVLFEGGSFGAALARYNPDGTLDSSFGAAGKTALAYPDGGVAAFALALQSDGKILGGGHYITPTSAYSTVFRLNGNGSFDGSFGIRGIANFPFSSVTKLLVQFDGKIIVVAGNEIKRLVAGGASFFDFDGDRKDDISVFRSSSSFWYSVNSTNGTFRATQFGLSTDKLVPADYDGDGETDVAVVRNGVWYLQRSQLGFVGIQFGDGNDIPVPGDYDGDGKAELAVFRPSNGYWYVLNITNNQFTATQFGISTDKPVPADYDGDGKTDIAVNRSGNWYIQRSQLGFTGILFGDGNDKLVPADYDGDGKADVAVFRPSNGYWYLLQSQIGFTGIAFGLGTDIPVAADYDGDRKTDLAVIREGNWYVQRSAQGFSGTLFGASTDLPIPNSFVR